MKSTWKTLSLAACLALAACASLPDQSGRAESHALPVNADTGLARALAPALRAHPGLSGFYPLHEGAEAFAARIALARAAQQSLDLQYYIFHADQTGIGLLAELLAAADRGVRVRLLLDDIHLGGQDDVLAAIDSHPNVEIRIFNPFARRGMRMLDFALDYGRVNRRMHNKSMTADGQATIVGGRNIGDEYFAAHSAVDFSDLDVLAAGPVVAKVAAVFDDYWNGAAAYPIASLAAAPPPGRLETIRAQAGASVAVLRDSAYARNLLETSLAQQIARGRLDAYWGKADVIADGAGKVLQPPDDGSTHALAAFTQFLEQAQSELLLVSPYFVPRREGVEWLGGLARRGIRVRILTNSFAATDVGAVHAGYAPHRKALLEAGVELYELKPTVAVAAADDRKALGGSSRASLHAKTYMVDRRRLFIGSLNLDPRSLRLNSEMGVIMESADLCARFGDAFDLQILDIAWQVTLLEDGKLAWTTRDHGEVVQLQREPGMGLLQSIGQTLLRILPVEEQL